MLYELTVCSSFIFYRERSRTAQKYAVSIDGYFQRDVCRKRAMEIIEQKERQLSTKGFLYGIWMFGKG